MTSKVKRNPKVVVFDEKCSFYVTETHHAPTVYSHLKSFSWPTIRNWKVAIAEKELSQYCVVSIVIMIKMLVKLVKALLLSFFFQQ